MYGLTSAFVYHLAAFNGYISDAGWRRQFLHNRTPLGKKFISDRDDIQSSSRFQMGFDLSSKLRAGSLDFKIPVAFFEGSTARRRKNKSGTKRNHIKPKTTGKISGIQRLNAFLHLSGGGGETGKKF